jgi:predicted lipoprotein with Yx(FWY)xxD motif
MRKLVLMLVLPAALFALASCGSSSKSTSTGAAYPATTSSSSPTSSSASSASSTVEISTKSLPGLGTVLVNGQGHTLYSFAPDKHSKVTCVSACAAVWPPVMLASGQRPAASGQAKSSLLGSDPDPAGGQVVTYGGWPLYTYVSDVSAGLASGQALNLNGGLWYVLAPSGKQVQKKP